MGKKFFSLAFIAWLILATPKVFATSSILLLGDSLSASYGMQQNEGWVHILNQQLDTEKAPYRIINASISGETTGGGLARIDSILAQQKFDYLLIELGGNDGLRGFSPKLIKNNLLQIINKAKAKNITVLVMAIKIPPNYGPRYNQMFEQVFVSVTEQSNAILLPFFVEQVAIKPELMQADGIHPNQAAQPQLAQFMKENLTNVIAVK
jgi:acyl-CoA thioesterase-1